jgi:sporulation protein YlmC with PRC-barrel domain
MKAICGFIAAGLVGTGVLAQDATTKIVEGETAGVPAQVEKGQAESQMEAQKGEAQPADRLEQKPLIGKTVYDEKGREIGRVQDLVMDMEKGELGYAVVEIKGEEGMKLPVPARALKLGEDGQKLVLNVSQNVLTALEIYREDELPKPDAFSVEEEAVGGAASSETGTDTSKNVSSSEEKAERAGTVEPEKATSSDMPHQE